MTRFNLLLLLAAAAVFLSPARAQEVLRVTWPTRHAAPPASATPEVAPYLSLIRTSLDRMSEAAVVKLAMAQAGAAGLSAAQADKLSDLVSRRYALIAANPVFKSVPSALPYCFSEKRPREGLAYVYRPAADTTATTPVLLFVHGSGGAFLWYLHQLAEWFPHHLIIAPAYGIDPSSISSAYLTESLTAASKRLGHPLSKPVLVGLSAGGFGATRAYATSPAPYQHLVVLAAYPPDESFRAWPRAGRAAFIVGENEYYVKDGGMASYTKTLAARSARFQLFTIPKADHFFLLTHPAETRRALNSALLSP